MWNFGDPGSRRTPSLRGPTMGTEPFHWNGDLDTFRALVDLTMVERMLLPGITDPQVDALARYVDAIPYLPRSAREGDDAVARGGAVFEGAACGGCHDGERLTNDETVTMGDVAVQVPPLREVGLRAPYLHDGSAATLSDALVGHGGYGALTATEQADRIAFLSTL